MIDSWSRDGKSNLIARASVGRSAGRESPVSIRTCPMRTRTFLEPLNREGIQKYKSPPRQKPNGVKPDSDQKK